MTPLRRWLRFNLVGLLGMAVQLLTLAALNRLLHGHYLLATGIAIEVTLLHNYAWHIRYTWRDRPPTPHRLSRFHLTNGALPLLANLLLMHLLVHSAHLPPIPANAVSIACCSIVNYTAANTLAFTHPPIRVPHAPRPLRSRRHQPTA